MAKPEKIQQPTPAPLDDRLENLKKLFPSSSSISVHFASCVGLQKTTCLCPANSFA